MMPQLPSYIDLKSVFCGVKDDSWIDRLKAKDYSIAEVLALQTAISR